MALYCDIEKEKDGKRNTLTKAYSNLMRNMWSGDPPISIAPTSVLYAVKLVFTYHCNVA